MKVSGYIKQDTDLAHVVNKLDGQGVQYYLDPIEKQGKIMLRIPGGWLDFLRQKFPLTPDVFMFSWEGKLVSHPRGWRGFSPLGGGGPLGGHGAN